MEIQRYRLMTDDHEQMLRKAYASMMLRTDVVINMEDVFHINIRVGTTQVTNLRINPDASRHYSTMIIKATAVEDPDSPYKDNRIYDFFRGCPLGEIVNRNNNASILVEPEDMEALLNWAVTDAKLDFYHSHWIATRTEVVWKEVWSMISGLKHKLVLQPKFKIVVELPKNNLNKKVCMTIQEQADNVFSLTVLYETDKTNHDNSPAYDYVIDFFKECNIPTRNIISYGAELRVKESYLNEALIYALSPVVYQMRECNEERYFPHFTHTATVDMYAVREN